MDWEYNNKDLEPITVLENGYYTGIMSGHIFTYNGKKYKCTDGVKGINCPVVIKVEDNTDIILTFTSY